MVVGTIASSAGGGEGRGGEEGRAVPSQDLDHAADD